MQPDQPTILVVEDDALVCEMLQILFGVGGYTAEYVADVPMTQDRLAVGGVDLLLLDVMLPEMDGLETCRRVRAREDEVYLPVIMATGAAGDAARHAGFEAGADDYVVKPFATEELLDRVRVWVGTSQRLRGVHQRLVAEQARLHELAQRALRERLAQDQAVLAMARTASHELNQPLTELLGMLELWQMSRYTPDTRHYTPDTHIALRDELQGAASDLPERVDLRSRVVRYEATELAGVQLLDLARTQEPSPTGN